MDRYEPFGSEPEVPPESSAEQPMDDASEAERQERLDYLRNIAPTRQKHGRWPVILAGVVVITLIGLGSWLALDHGGKAASKKAAPAKVAPSPLSQSSATTNYVSNGQDLNLSFDYPIAWSVSPPSNANPNDQPISVTSPLTTITTATGGSTTGRVIISIRPVSAQLSELSAGNATAAQASSQFGYAKPTANQFQYPFLTFIHQPTAGNPASAFQEVFVTGTTQFNAGDSITADSFSVDPIISASFFSCTTTVCDGPDAVPLNITNNTWQNASIFNQTLSVLESLRLN
jgi:hypothetical protein